MDTKEVFGKNLKKIRSTKGLTQAELAEKAQISPQMVSSYEKMKKDPSLTNAVNIAAALGVSLDSLVTGEMDGIMSTVRLNTYGDVAREIITLQQVLHAKLSVDDYDPDDCDGRYVETITFEDDTLAPFFSNTRDMLDLLNRGTINDDLFNSWLAGQLSLMDEWLLFLENPPRLKRTY